jgi:hypothetical protein
MDHMNLLDIILLLSGGASLGVLGHTFFLELKATGKIKPAITATEAKIEGLGQVLEHESQTQLQRFEAFAASFNPEDLLKRIETTMSQAGDDLAAKISALPAVIEAKATATITDLQSQLAAEQADHAADLAKVGDAVNAAMPPA